MQKNGLKRKKIAADKMVNVSLKKLPGLSVGDSIMLSVPNVNRGPLDLANILGVITDKRNDVYQIGTVKGIIKGWIPREVKVFQRVMFQKIIS